MASGLSKGASQNIQVDEPYYLGGLSEEIKENERLQGNVEVPAACDSAGVLWWWRDRPPWILELLMWVASLMGALVSSCRSLVSLKYSTPGFS